ncbi:hypothetical protein [Streptomyces sp. NPDC095602]|uniref:hypothetical protein n=1 Tax=Streptomyces sp. NPDC095602 TaxID=3155819 RepID=UPI003319866E
MPKKTPPAPRHFVLTLQWTLPPTVEAPPAPGQSVITLTTDRTASATYAAVIHPAPGTTREQLFLDALAATRKALRVPDGASVVVLHWSIGRNEIT